MPNPRWPLLALSLTSTIAVALERQVGPLDLELELSAGSQAAQFKDPLTRRSDSETQLLWSVGFGLERLMDNGAILGMQMEFDDGKRESDELERDELSVYYASELGRFELGEQDGASQALSLRAPLVGLGQVRGEFARYVGDAALLSAYDTSDALKLSFVSAPWKGLRLGASYVPHFERNESSPDPRNRTSQRRGVELGAQLQQPAGAWLIGVSSAYVRAKADPLTTRADIDSWSAGWQARREQLTLGGGYVVRGDSDRLAPYDQREFSLGASWREERWALAISTAFETSLPQDTRLLGIGATRELGEYVVLRGDLVHVQDRLASGLRRSGLVAVLEAAVEF